MRDPKPVLPANSTTASLSALSTPGGSPRSAFKAALAVGALVGIPAPAGGPDIEVPAKSPIPKHQAADIYKPGPNPLVPPQAAPPAHSPAAKPPEYAQPSSPGVIPLGSIIKYGSKLLDLPVEALELNRAQRRLESDRELSHDVRSAVGLIRTGKCSGPYIKELNALIDSALKARRPESNYSPSLTQPLGTAQVLELRGLLLVADGERNADPRTVANGVRAFRQAAARHGAATEEAREQKSRVLTEAGSAALGEYLLSVDKKPEKLNTALEIFSDAARLDPKSNAAVIGKAVVHLAAGNSEAALALAEQVVKNKYFDESNLTNEDPALFQFSAHMIQFCCALKKGDKVALAKAFDDASSVFAQLTENKLGELSTLSVAVQVDHLQNKLGTTLFVLAANVMDRGGKVTRALKAFGN